MKKKGFTLIEILAVIVILASIVLITTPKIIDVLENTKMEAFKDNVLSTFHEVDYYLVKNNMVRIPEEGLDVTQMNLIKNPFAYGQFYQKEEEVEVVNISDGSYCAMGTMDNLQVYKGECDTTIPRCSLKIEGEKGAGNWYFENPKVVMETSEAKAGGLQYGIGKEENYEKFVENGKKGKEEYQTIGDESTRVYCYVKNIGDQKGSNYIDVKIDKTTPEEATFSYSTTSKSIRVVAAGKDKESGIVRYQFSKDGGESWTSIQASNVYTYEELEEGEYEIKVRVYNGTYVEKRKEKNLYKESESKKVKTESIEEPEYEVSPKGWTKGEVKVTIKYQGEVTKLFKTTVGVTSNTNAVECSVTNGQYTCEGTPTREIKAGVWYEVGENPELTFKENGDVIAQATDGINTKSGSSMSIDNIDIEEPTIEVEVSGKEVQLTMKDKEALAGYQITNSTTTPTSWIEIEGVNVSIKWTATSGGTYYAHVKDGAGRTKYTKFEISTTLFCQYSPGQVVKEFSYRGSVEEYAIPCDGIYKLEVWGAKGGTATYHYAISSLGCVAGSSDGDYAVGTASGNFNLSKGRKLYVYVGGQGGAGITRSDACEYNYSTTSGAAGYNGGVAGSSGSSGSGGATHIALTTGTYSTTLLNSGNILVSAKGGGGIIKGYGDYKISQGSGGGTNYVNTSSSYFIKNSQSTATGITSPTSMARITLVSLSN